VSPTSGISALEGTTTSNLDLLTKYKDKYAWRQALEPTHAHCRLYSDFELRSGIYNSNLSSSNDISVLRCPILLVILPYSPNGGKLIIITCPGNIQVHIACDNSAIFDFLLKMHQNYRLQNCTTMKCQGTQSGWIYLLYIYQDECRDAGEHLPNFFFCDSRGSNLT